jgi:N-acyl-D-amino-acid deacylase
VVYETHIGSEGYQLLEELEKAIQVAEVTGLPVQIAHFKVRGRSQWRNMERAIQRVEEARRRGLDVTANQYPYTAMWQGWADFFPSWLLDAPDAVEKLKDPAVRARVRKDPQFIQFFEEHGGVEGVTLLAGAAAVKQYDGMRVEAIAKARASDPIDTVFDMVVENGAFPGGLYHNMSEENVRRVMALPWVAIASDGSALRVPEDPDAGVVHPRHYGTFPRVLGKYVREERLLTLEDAVRKMTGLPAQVLRLQDRGRLLEGYWADVVIFNPETVIDRATFEKPHQYSEGIEYVAVNGVLVIDQGRHTGKRPGRGIYGSGYQRRTATETDE